MEGTVAATDEARRTLGALVERLHPAVIDVAVAPRGLDLEVGDPLILDPAEALPVVTDAVVLAVGTDGERAQVGLLRRLGEAGAAAMIVKSPGPPAAPVLAEAEDAGVAVLVAPPPLSWGQLYTLLLTAASTVTTATPALAEAPLGDLFALANAVAAVVGGATTIEDPHSRVLAYSNLDHPIDLPRQETILGRQVPGAWIQRLHDTGVFRRLWQTDDVVHIPDFVDEPGYMPRIAVAVRAGGELLGSIWVIEGAQPLGPEAERTLREAADISALHLLRHRSASDVDRRRRADALLAMLEGRDSARPNGVGRSGGGGSGGRDVLAIEPGEPVAVVAFHVGPAGDATALMSAQRVADLVAVYCESYRRRASCAASEGRVYALVPAEAGQTDDALLNLAQTIVDRAQQALRLPLRAGVGSIGTGPDGVVASRREADEVLDVLGQDVSDAAGQPEVAAIDAVRSRVILNRLRQLADGSPGLAAGKVAALVEQDATKGTSWVPTLRAYFDAFGDMAAAAAQVNVHPNTFRYRLRRIVELFGLDLTDPDERLVAELQLRFLDARG